jgi:hypothetical protein
MAPRNIEKSRNVENRISEALIALEKKEFSSIAKAARSF